MDQIKKYYIGDACYCIQLSDSIDIEISKKILSLYKRIKDSSTLKESGVFDTVPSYNSVAVHFLSNLQNAKRVEFEIDNLLANAENESSDIKFNVFELPVRYNGEDLGRVARLNNLTIKEVIDLHSSSDFTVAMIGFTPLFPYLIGLDEKIITPRLAKPRTKIPKGSVAIGGAQTGIYPQESPGGWNLIGITDTEILKRIQPGDRIKFIPVGDNK